MRCSAPSRKPVPSSFVDSPTPFARMASPSTTRPRKGPFAFPIQPLLPTAVFGPHDRLRFSTALSIKVDCPEERNGCQKYSNFARPIHPLNQGRRIAILYSPITPNVCPVVPLHEPYHSQNQLMLPVAYGFNVVRSVGHGAATLEKKGGLYHLKLANSTTWKPNPARDFTSVFLSGSKQRAEKSSQASHRSFHWSLALAHQ